MEQGLQGYNAGVNIHQANHVNPAHLQQRPPVLVYQGIQYVPLTQPQAALLPRPLLNVQYQENGPQGLRPVPGPGNVPMAAPHAQQAPVVREAQIVNGGAAAPQDNAAAPHAIAATPQAVTAAGPKTETADAAIGRASSLAKDTTMTAPEHRDPVAANTNDGATVDDGNIDHTTTGQKQRRVRNDNKYNKIPLPSSFSDGIASQPGDAYARDPNPFAGLAKLAKVWKTHKDETYNNNMFDGLPLNYCAIERLELDKDERTCPLGSSIRQAVHVVPRVFPAFQESDGEGEHERMRMLLVQAFRRIDQVSCEVS